MKSKPTILESDLMAAVLEATAPPADPGVSVAEYAAANPGLSLVQADLRLRKGVRAGKLVSGWAVRWSPDQGQCRRVRVYRIK